MLLSLRTLSITPLILTFSLLIQTKASMDGVKEMFEGSLYSFFGVIVWGSSRCKLRAFWFWDGLDAVSKSRTYLSVTYYVAIYLLCRFIGRYLLSLFVAVLLIWWYIDLWATDFFQPSHLFYELTAVKLTIHNKLSCLLLTFPKPLRHKVTLHKLMYYYLKIRRVLHKDNDDVTNYEKQ